MQKKPTEDTFVPSFFEEPELYESMQILKKRDNLKMAWEKNLYDLKNCRKKEKHKARERIKSKLKRPQLDLEKMMKVQKKTRYNLDESINSI